MSTEPPHISIMNNRNSYVFMEVNNITLHYLVATFLGQAYFFSFPPLWYVLMNSIKSYSVLDLESLISPFPTVSLEDLLILLDLSSQKLTVRSRGKSNGQNAH